jgi:hypothetical protein
LIGKAGSAPHTDGMLHKKGFAGKGAEDYEIIHCHIDKHRFLYIMLWIGLHPFQKNNQ